MQPEDKIKLFSRSRYTDYSDLHISTSTIFIATRVTEYKCLDTSSTEKCTFKYHTNNLADKQQHKFVFL